RPRDDRARGRLRTAQGVPVRILRPSRGRRVRSPGRVARLLAARPDRRDDRGQHPDGRTRAGGRDARDARGDRAAHGRQVLGPGPGRDRGRGRLGAGRPVPELLLERGVRSLDRADRNAVLRSRLGALTEGRRAHPPSATDPGHEPVMNSPPSTLMMSPLMKAVPSPERARIAFATSWGVVIRPVGFRFIVMSIIVWASGILRRAGVSVTPARIAFTVTPEPLRASSIASWRTCDSSAAFADETTP